MRLAPWASTLQRGIAASSPSQSSTCYAAERITGGSVPRSRRNRSALRRLRSALRGEQLRLLEPVQESVLRAYRRPLPGGFAQLGQRRQASPWSAGLVSAERPAILVLRQSDSPRLHASGFSAAVQCCLTPRSSRAPTACHAGPVGGTRYIFANRARAPHRRCRLNSNVRHHDLLPKLPMPT